jgi:carbon-monoxide dehydrogenase medium subunit
VAVPVTPAGRGAAYVKHEHPASGYAVVGAAAVVALDGGTCSSVRVAIGGAVASCVRANAVEDALTGSAPSTEAFADAADHAAAALPSPTGDAYASGEYRLQLAKVLTKRALATAADRAG